MADIQGIRTKQSNLTNIPYANGQLIITDEGNAYIDFPDSKRIQIRNITIFVCSVDLPTQAKTTITVSPANLTHASGSAIQLQDLVIGKNGILGQIVFLSSTAVGIRTLGNNMPIPTIEENNAILTVQNGTPTWVIPPYITSYDEDTNTVTFS